MFVLLAAVMGLFIFFPIYWMFITALKPASEAFQQLPSIVPFHPTLGNFTDALTQSQLPRYVFNSLIAAGAAAVVSTVLGAYAAYGLSMYQYRGSRLLMYFFLAGQMFPFALLLVTIYPMLLSWHLTDTYLGLILSYVVFSLPATIYILYSYFSKVPVELIEAARMDGSSEFRTLHSIVLPISAPGLVAVWLFAFMWGWNDLLFSLTLITSEKLRMLGPGLLVTYMGQFRDNWGGIMAASLLASVPIVALFAALQRYFIQGLTAGAVKG
jgi:multiple sugar transport system permease protein